MGVGISSMPQINSRFEELNKILHHAGISIRTVNDNNIDDANLVLSRSECSGTLRRDLLMVIVYYNKIPTGFLSLDYDNEHCGYIDYMCATETTIKGIGALLGFLSVFLSIILKKNMVFATGVGKTVMIPKYPREGVNEIVISQYILIDKLGFIDGYKTSTFDLDKLIAVSKKCGDAAETYLDLIYGDMTKYEDYKRRVIDMNLVKSLFPLK
jgi:hypothetical protein